ncbi:helix-turn-helix domain-containing protein [Halomonas aquamarina]|uniref:Helix-turn-helix domain-containing protein n=1 Tax=Vreelandella aquamarina TaxID=77097 RepID=A0ACC5VQC7_9GAMM|nr:helix-turn-helix domain-containing protein [Halomonas aquamarina]MBZ5486455.1 helix-turn-helix domain-containing protein [Halomonas aquamarina]
MSTKHLSPEVLSERRKKAVRLRLDGHTVAVASQQTGLSAPTVSAAWKAFREGGWAAVPVKPRGRSKGQGNTLSAAAQALLWDGLYAPAPRRMPGWSSAALADLANERLGLRLTQRAIEHWWETEELKHYPWALAALAKKRTLAGRWFDKAVAPAFLRCQNAEQRWQGGVRRVAHAHRALYQIYLHGVRGKLYMRCFEHPPTACDYQTMLSRLTQPAVVVFHGAMFSANQELAEWLASQTSLTVVAVPADLGLEHR